MTKVLVDTSVWIDFFNDRDLPAVHSLANFLQNEWVCSCPPVIQEVLQGIRNEEQHILTKNHLLSLEIVGSDPVEAAIGASDLYRSLRKKGTTIRKSNDCLIAWYAIHHKVKLLQNDSDFVQIAEHTALQLC
jgi:predicted nucleic acid-binding protein